MAGDEGFERMRSRQRQGDRANLVLKIIAAIFLVVGFGGTGWAWFFYSGVQSITVPRQESLRLDYYVDYGVPALQIVMYTTFTGQGSISVDNPITVHVLISNITSPTDFLTNYYGVMKFTDAYTVDSAGSADPKPFLIQLVNGGNGTVVGNGVMTWLVAGGTWPIFLPSKGGTIVINYNVIEQGPPSTTVGTLDETNNWKNAQFDARAWYTVISFLPVGALGAFEVLRKR